MTELLRIKTELGPLIVTERAVIVERRSWFRDEVITIPRTSIAHVRVSSRQLGPGRRLTIYTTDNQMLDLHNVDTDDALQVQQLLMQG